MQVLIFENFNKAKQVLNSLDKDINDKQFKELVDIVSIKGYIGLFTKYHFVDGVSFEKLEHLNNRLLKLKAILPKMKKMFGKNVDEYIDLNKDKTETRPDIEILEDDLTKLEETQAIQKMYKQLPKSWREQLANTSKENRERFDSLSREIGQSTEYRSFFKKLSKIKSIDELLDKMEELYERIKGGLDYDSVKERIEKISNLVYENNNRLIALITSFDESQELGSKSWCISTDEHYWEQYLEEEELMIETNIYFIWDFNLRISDKMHQIGVVREWLDFGAAHDKEDNSIDVMNLPYFKEIKPHLERNTDMDHEVSDLIKSKDIDTEADMYAKYGEGIYIKQYLEIAIGDGDWEEFFESNDKFEILKWMIHYNDFDTIQWIVESLEHMYDNFEEDEKESMISQYPETQIDDYSRLIEKSFQEKNMKLLKYFVEKQNGIKDEMRYEDGWITSFSYLDKYEDIDYDFLDEYMQMVKDKIPESQFEVRNLYDMERVRFYQKWDIKMYINGRYFVSDYIRAYENQNKEMMKFMLQNFKYDYVMLAQNRFRDIVRYDDFVFMYNNIESDMKDDEKVAILTSYAVRGIDVIDEKARNVTYSIIKFLLDKGIKPDDYTIDNICFTKEMFDLFKGKMKYTFSCFKSILNYYFGRRSVYLTDDIPFDEIDGFYMSLMYMCKNLDKFNISESNAVSFLNFVDGIQIKNNSLSEKFKIKFSHITKTLFNRITDKSWLAHEGIMKKHNGMFYLMLANDEFKNIALKTIIKDYDILYRSVSSFNAIVMTYCDKFGDKEFIDTMFKKYVDNIYTFVDGKTYSESKELYSYAWYFTDTLKYEIDKEYSIKLVDIIDQHYVDEIMRILDIGKMQIDKQILVNALIKKQPEKIKTLVNSGLLLDEKEAREIIDKNNIEEFFFDMVTNNDTASRVEIH
jgi:hypothetical protein